MTTRADVVAEAKSWCGTRYKHQASIKGLGADCIGFVGGVGVALGLPEWLVWSKDPTCKGYARRPDPAQVMSGVRKYFDPVPIAQAGCGDVLLIGWEAEPQHFGIISSVKPLRMIHCYATARKVAETGIDGEWRAGKTWRSLIVSALRFRGVA